jgi:glucose-fructose oxidoreductase
MAIRKTKPTSGAVKTVKKASRKEAKPAAKKAPEKVRYAVVGLGYFSQKFILPAFANAKENSELVALVSDDPEKLKKLGKKYGASKGYSYDEYASCLAEGGIDAVYIALPNDMHREFASKAAKRGIHVLCEKPMALNERDCEEMIRAANEHHTRLMIAYRLHLEPANLKAIEAVQSGQIGDPRFFSSAFSMQVKDGGIRTRKENGGGPAWDLGVYCINAARYLFRDEPIEVLGRTASKSGDPRFSEVEEMASAILTFPGDRQAVFTCSFGAADSSWFSVMGTKGYVHLNQAYDYALPSTLHISTGGKMKSQEFKRKDQVAAELLYFSDCVLTGKEPEPSGVEGLADVRVIRALYESAKAGRPVQLERFEKRTRPSEDMAIVRPPAEQEDLFHAEAPTLD